MFVAATAPQKLNRARFLRESHTISFHPRGNPAIFVSMSMGTPQHYLSSLHDYRVYGIPADSVGFPRPPSSRRSLTHAQRDAARNNMLLCWCKWRWWIWMIAATGGLTAQVDWLGLRVGGHLVLSLHSSYRHVRKTRKFFSKYADHVIAKYVAKICGNRPRLHIRVKLTWYILEGDGIAQLLFSKLTAYQSLESTCIGLIGSNNFFNLQQQIVCIIVRYVHLTTNIDYPQIQKLE